MQLANEKAVNAFQRFSDSYGYLRSIVEESPVDAFCKPIPGYTYPAIEYLSQLDFSNLNIFEYGGGYSSLWWSTRSQRVVSVDNNNSRHNQLNKQKQNNQVMLLAHADDKMSYVQSLDEVASETNVVVIDGAYQAECVGHIEKAIESKLLSCCMIIINDSFQLQDCLNQCPSLKDFIRIDFCGMGPVRDYTWTTSVFLSKKEPLPVATIRASLASQAQ